jgi:hypothetical protein
MSLKSLRSIRYNKYDIKYRLDHKDDIKTSRLNRREQIKKYNEKYVLENKDKIKELKRLYGINHKKEIQNKQLLRYYGITLNEKIKC